MLDFHLSIDLEDNPNLEVSEKFGNGVKVKKRHLEQLGDQMSTAGRLLTDARRSVWTSASVHGRSGPHERAPKRGLRFDLYRVACLI